MCLTITCDLQDTASSSEFWTFWSKDSEEGLETVLDMKMEKKNALFWFGQLFKTMSKTMLQHMVWIEKSNTRRSTNGFNYSVCPSFEIHFRQNLELYQQSRRDQIYGGSPACISRIHHLPHILHSVCFVNACQRRSIRSNHKTIVLSNPHSHLVDAFCLSLPTDYESLAGNPLFCHASPGTEILTLCGPCKQLKLKALIYTKIYAKNLELNFLFALRIT